MISMVETGLGFSWRCATCGKSLRMLACKRQTCLRPRPDPINHPPYLGAAYLQQPVYIANLKVTESDQAAAGVALSMSQAHRYG